MEEARTVQSVLLRRVIDLYCVEKMLKFMNFEQIKWDANGCKMSSMACLGMLTSLTLAENE